MRKIFVSSISFLFLMACGSSATDTASSVVPAPATDQKPVVPEVTTSGEATATPASMFPQVANSGGVVVAKPKIMPVYFPGYAQRAKVDAFHAAYAKSTHWAGAVSEYGVGPQTLLPSVTRTDTAAANVSDDDIKVWLRANLGEGRLLGAADADTAYVLYFPTTTTVTLDGSASCSTFGGYHNEVTLGDGVTRVGYAIIPTCNEASLFVTSDHEMVEWATDRFPYTAPAYQNLKPEFAAFGLMGGGEISDVCTFLEGVQAQASGARSSGYTPADLGFKVQRHFSNKASAAGRFPCGPNYNETFLVGIPQLTESQNLMPGGATKILTTSGGSGELKIKIHADAKVSEPWRFFATALSFGGGQARMKVSLDKNRVLPGDEVTLTISESKERQAGIMLITSSPDGQTSHSWPFVVLGK